MPNYSYFIIIFDSKNITPYGVYAYGFYIQKDPRIQYPSLYGIGGTQNEWFFLGYIENECIELKLLIDRELNMLSFRFNSRTATVTKKHNISFDGLTIKIASFNKSSQPKILVKYIVVGETNNKDIVNTLLEVFPKEVEGVNIILNISAVQTSISPTTSASPSLISNTSYKPSTGYPTRTTGVVSEMPSHANGWINKSLIGIVLAITVIFILTVALFTIWRKKTHK